MNTRVQKWGNSLAIRIPKPFASELGLDNDSEVQLSYQDGKLIISPLPIPKYHLSDLLPKVRKSNLHRQVDTGTPQGREAW